MLTPAQRIGQTHGVLLLGFSRFERDALASGFRLAAVTRQPAYRLVAGLAQAELVVADAEQPAAIGPLQRAGRLRDTVFVGAAAPAGAGGWTMRPIDPLHVLRALDLLATRAQATAPAATPGTWLPTAAVAAAPAAPASTLRRRDDEDGPAPVTAPAAQPVQPPLPLLRPARDTDALLIDAGTLRGLDRLLQGLGLRTRRIAGDTQTLARLAEASCGIVFIDTADAGAFDALALCHAVKHGAATACVPGPAVVLVAAEVGGSDRVRGALAGCDAWLANPPAPAELHATLQRLGARIAPLEGTRRRR